MPLHMRRRVAVTITLDLTALTPDGLEDQVFLDSAGQAVENAVRSAIRDGTVHDHADSVAIPWIEDVSSEVVKHTFTEDELLEQRGG